jgi:dTMP kinase
MADLFITFEGGEGTGKTTQIARLAAELRAQGRHVVMTREPGGTASAEEIRSLLVNGEPGKWSSTAEALLNYAAREQHLRDVIRPALMAEKIVLCDRFMDSTRVYQAIAGDCDISLIESLENTVVGETRPKITFVFDLAPKLGLGRAALRHGDKEDRYERKGAAFHEAVRQGFLDIARQEPQRCIVIDAGGDIETIAASITASLKERGLG